MIYNLLEKIKSFIRSNAPDLYIAVLIIFVSLISFGLGRLSVLWPEREPIKIINSQPPIINEGKSSKTVNTESEAASIIPTVKGKYIASKNGTAYHYPWCPGATKIKEVNKVWFQSKEEAEKRGYKPAGNCEGL